jgi:hypothetical protein
LTFSFGKFIVVRLVGIRIQPAINKMKFVRAISGSVLSCFLFLFIENFAHAQSKDVLTYHNDNARTGQYTNETILSPANVNFSNFGKLWFLNADAHVDAEPLRAGGVLIPGVGFRNVVFVATENDSVCAYDADSTNLFWQASLVGVGETASDDRNCLQVSPLIGITGAPVIDRQLGPNGTLFAVAMSKVTASGAYVQRLYALDLATGTNRMPAVTITGSYPGTGDNSSGGYVIFDPAQYKERAGLLLLGGVIYTAWASHCDGGLYTGWIMGYDERTLVQTNIINVTPNGSRGAIWMGNTALAADSSNNIVFLDANGTFDGQTNGNGFPVNNNFGNAFIKLSNSNLVLSVADYFATSNTISQSTGDQDLGSGGAIVLPSMNDSHGVAHQLAVGAGKDANIYIVDLANMGKYNSNTNAIYQQVSGALGSSVFSMPAYFDSTLYYCANGDRLRAFPFSNARLGATPVQSPGAAGSTGATPSISASNGLNGIVWVVQAPSSSAAVLHAYSAANVAVELYNSSQAAGNRDYFGGGNKYATPMIANGKVYVGATSGVAVFGLLSQSAPVLVQSLAFLSQPANSLLGNVISPEVDVQAFNAGNQPVVGTSITISLASGPGGMGGTLTRSTDANGIAHFNDLAIYQAGTTSLTASPGYGAAMAAVNSNPFSVIALPIITNVTINKNGSVTMVYATTPGLTYHVQTATTLSAAIWASTPGSTTNATGTSVTFTDTSSASSPARFYRVVSP